jgi:hypothetical protein
MKTSKKGSAGTEIILAAAVIIYILLPLFAAIVQKNVIYNQAEKIKQAIEMSVISLISENSTNDFSSGLLIIITDEDILRDIIYQEIKCINEKMIVIPKDDISVNIYQSGNICSCGFTNSHYMISVDLTAIFNYLGTRNIHIHKHIEFPIIR